MFMRICQVSHGFQASGEVVSPYRGPAVSMCCPAAVQPGWKVLTELISATEVDYCTRPKHTARRPMMRWIIGLTLEWPPRRAYQVGGPGDGRPGNPCHIALGVGPAIQSRGLRGALGRMGGCCAVIGHRPITTPPSRFITTFSPSPPTNRTVQAAPGQ